MIPWRLRTTLQCWIVTFKGIISPGIQPARPSCTVAVILVAVLFALGLVLVCDNFESDPGTPTLLRLLLLQDDRGETGRDASVPGAPVIAGAFRLLDSAMELFEAREWVCLSMKLDDVSRIRFVRLFRLVSTGSRVTMRGLGGGKIRTSIASWNRTLRSQLVVVVMDVGRVNVEDMVYAITPRSNYDRPISTHTF